MPITEDRAFLTAPEPASPAGRARPSPRGRPLLMSRERVLERIRTLAAGDGGLFRVHRGHPALYARARRLFGSWSGAVAAAGLDYPFALAVARERSLRNRRVRDRARRRAGRP